MVYSVGLPAPAAIAALTAIHLMQREPERVTRLQSNGKRFLRRRPRRRPRCRHQLGLRRRSPSSSVTRCAPSALADRLLGRGYNAFPIIPPGVPERSARLRFFISSEHTEAELDGAVAAIVEELGSLGGLPGKPRAAA